MCTLDRFILVPWTKHPHWIFQSCLNDWSLFLTLWSPLGDSKDKSPTWRGISHLVASDRSLLPMYQNHFANQTKAEEMEVVEMILQNCATAPKQISNVVVDAAGRHVRARTELKYICLRLRQKPVTPSLWLLNSNTAIGSGLWLQVTITTNQPVTWTAKATKVVWSYW